MPVRDLQRRHREIGRLRMGAKGQSKDGKEIPVKLKTWRLTSPNLAALNAAAELWGGTVGEWEGQYELITEHESLPVLVPPQDLEGSQWYTLYSGGGILRRCDGTTELESDGPCICMTEVEGTEDERQCSVTTHLLVVLPQLPDIGVWRLTSHGWNAASELANTIDVLEQFVAQGNMPEAVLAIEPRTSKKDGTTRKFLVPVLRIPRSLEALSQGRGQGPAALPGQPFDPETGEILEPNVLEHNELPAGLARSGQEGAAGSGSDGPGPADTSVEPESPADATAPESNIQADVAAQETEGEDEAAVTPPSSPAGDPDDGTPATKEQWALLDRHGINPNKILTQVRKLFPKAGIGSKSEITKFQFSKAFGAVQNERAGL